MQPILYSAPPWQSSRSDYIILWHGCTELDKDNIEKYLIDPARGRVDADFGRGFYTTTQERQARHWAWKRLGEWKSNSSNTGKSNRPVVLRFRVPRYGVQGRGRGLDELNSLHFVLGNHDNEDYWSLVQHCRQSMLANPSLRQAAIVNDRRRPPAGWYDLVGGPVAAFWEQRAAMQDADQLSFHTDVAVAILNDLIQSAQHGSSAEYSWLALL
jgi:hypothetical protein